MSKFSIRIGGAQVVEPGVYTESDVTAMLPARGFPARRMVIIAEGQGGAVGAVTRITAPSQIREVLRGGHLAQLAQVANRAGLTEIDTIRVGQATPATLNWGNLTLTDKNPGIGGRSKQGKRVQNPNRADAVDIYIRDAATGENETFLNVGPMIDVTYLGSGTSPQCVVSVAGDLYTLTFTATAASGDTVTITSLNAPTVAQIVDALNRSASWTARAICSEDVPTSTLVPATYTVTADIISLSGGNKLQARVLEGSTLVSGTVAGGASSSTGDYQYFTGGDEGPATTTQDWINALELAEDLDAIAVVLGTGNGAVIAAGRTHVYDMSSVINRRERRLYVGPDFQSTKAAMKTAVQSIISASGGDRVIVAANGVQDYNISTSELKTYPAFYLACFVAALKCLNAPEFSPTNKQITLPGIQFNWKSRERVELLEMGALPAHKDTELGLNVITQGVTSHIRDANVMLRKINGGDIVDYLQKKTRMRLKSKVGEVGDQTIINVILAEVEALLQEEVRTATNRTGVLTAGIDPRTNLPVPAFENIKVIMDGFDVTGVEFNCHPVGEIAFLPVKLTFTPVKIVATA